MGEKIRQRTFYFGRFEDGWEAALERYKWEVDDLQAGREPRAYDEALTFTDPCSCYLDAANDRVATGEMRPDSSANSKRTAEIAVKVIGRGVRWIRSAPPTSSGFGGDDTVLILFRPP